jgi:nucleoid DNA-binding protein
MHIILRSDKKEQRVINIIYGDNIYITKAWILEYLNDEKESLSMCPNLEDIKYSTYKIEEHAYNIWKLNKIYKKINKGYIYNTSEKLQEDVFTIQMLEFNENTESQSLANIQINNTWRDLNNEINNRVLKQLDKESLYQVITKIQEKVQVKSVWNRNEYTALISETIKDFKKELYSNIVKKLKRFGKKEIDYQNTNLYKNKNSGNMCSLEAKKKIE